jgi:hypothetical protein
MTRSVQLRTSTRSGSLSLPYAATDGVIGLLKIQHVSKTDIQDLLRTSLLYGCIAADPISVTGHSRWPNARCGGPTVSTSPYCSAWQTLDAINNSSKHKYLDTLKSPIYSTVEEGSQLELGFAILDENDN